MTKSNKPSGSKSNQNQSELSFRKEQIFSGPVPPPEVLEKYEQIQPGFAERLLKMAEKEQESRIESQQKAFDAEKELATFELNNYKRGQIFALVSVFLVVALCGYALFKNFDKSARDIGVAVIIGVAGVFITGRVLKSKKRK